MTRKTKEIEKSISFFINLSHGLGVIIDEQSIILSINLS